MRLIGVSLKMYFGVEQTRRWLEGVSRLVPLPSEVELFVLPSFPSLACAREILEGTGIGYGAQNLWYQPLGPVTGEVPASMLRELGCRYVAVGHAERRLLFGESDKVVALKAAAAMREGLVPVVCVGEDNRCMPRSAARVVEAQLEACLEAVPDGVLVVAYEPKWAIGGREAAPADLVWAVTAAIRRLLNARSGMSRVVYGGSAAPGTFSKLAGGGGDASPDGLFLGRSAHCPARLKEVIDEMAAVGKCGCGSGVR